MEGGRVMPIILDANSRQFNAVPIGKADLVHGGGRTQSQALSSVVSDGGDQAHVPSEGQIVSSSTAHSQDPFVDNRQHASNYEASLLQQENNLVQESEVPGSSELQTPVIDIIINNVVCTFATRCHLNLRKIATEAMHVVYKREHGMVSMKLRKPYTTASIWSSGKITCTGATSEIEAKIAARRISRILQTLGFRVRFSSFRVVNVLGTCAFPWGIRITQFSRDHPQNASYEPELHPGVTYRIKQPKATLKVFSTGSITVTAPCVDNVQYAIEHIYPLVSAYKMDNPHKDHKEISNTRLHLMPANRSRLQQRRARLQMEDSENSDTDCDEDDSEEEDSEDSRV